MNAGNTTPEKKYYSYHSNTCTRNRNTQFPPQTATKYIANKSQLYKMRGGENVTEREVMMALYPSFIHLKGQKIG